MVIKMEYYGNNDWRDYIRSRNELMHYGTPKHSGRYPWGSGEDPYHHGADNPRSRYKTRKAKIKDDVKSRRLAFNKEVQDYLDDFNSTHTKGQKLSDEDRRRGKEFSDDFNKRWAESEAKYKSDLKSAKEQYKSEKQAAKNEKERSKKQAALTREMLNTSNQIKIYNKAAHEFNNRIESINEKYPGLTVDDYKYVKAVSDEWKKIYSGIIDSEYKNRAFSLIDDPSEEKWENVRSGFLYYNMYDEMLKDLKK